MNISFAPSNQSRAIATVSGYASIFDRLDRSNDIVKSGAFHRTLQNRGPANARMLLEHSPGLTIGKWASIVEDETGLYVQGVLTQKVGVHFDLSIGYKTVKSVNKVGCRHLLEVDLWEISLTRLPLLDGTKATITKIEDMPCR